jgi:hypothetical protein
MNKNSNIFNIVNKEKIDQTAKIEDFNLPDEPIGDDVISVSDRPAKYKPIIRINDNPMKRRRSISNLSDIEDDNEYMKKKNDSNVFFNDDIDRMKYEYSRIFDIYRKKNFDVEKVNNNSDIEKFKMVYDDLMWRIDKENKYEIFTTTIWAISWAVEKAASLVGKSFVLSGWSDHVWKTKDEFRTYFDKMTRPIYVKDMFSNKIIRKENNSLISRLNMPTEIEVLIAITRSAITFSALKNLEKITEFINNNFDEEPEISNLKK